MQNLLGHRSAGRHDEILEAARRQDGTQRARRGNERDAGVSELRAMVELRHGEDVGGVVHVDALVQLLLAHQPQPLQPVPVRRGEQAHRRRDVDAGERPAVRVDEAEERLEGGGLDAVDLDARRGGLHHRAQELRVEHRRPCGEHAPVRAEHPAAQAERHVRAPPVAQHPRQVLVEARRRHRDAGAPLLGRRDALHARAGDHGDHAPYGQGVVVEARVRRRRRRRRQLGFLDELEDVGAAARRREVVRPQRVAGERRRPAVPGHQAQAVLGSHEPLLAAVGEAGRRVAGGILVEAIGVERDIPVMAGDAEVAGADVPSGAEAVHQRVADHLEVVRPGDALPHAP